MAHERHFDSAQVLRRQAAKVRAVKHYITYNEKKDVSRTTPGESGFRQPRKTQASPFGDTKINNFRPFDDCWIKLPSYHLDKYT